MGLLELGLWVSFMEYDEENNAVPSASLELSEKAWSTCKNEVDQEGEVKESLKRCRS